MRHASPSDLALRRLRGRFALVLVVLGCSAPPPTGHLGDLCNRSADCTPELACVYRSNPPGSVRVCTSACVSPDECTPGWSCIRVGDTSMAHCDCSPSVETCGGRDEDCDGRVDEGFDACP
jgi:hypothetical protein